MKKIALALAAVMIAGLLVGCAGDDKIEELESQVSKLEKRIDDLEDWKTQAELEEQEKEASKPDLAAIYDMAQKKECVTLSGDGLSLTIDTNPDDKEDYFSTDALDFIQVVNHELGLPDAVYERMVSTRALDGTQTADYDNVFVSWSYHPDNGLKVIYEAK